MMRLSLLLGLILIGACSDDTGPGSVTTTTLTGYWNNDGDLDHPQTVFGFVKAANVREDIEPSNIEYPTGVDLSAVYRAIPGQLMLQQVATYSVSDSTLFQTVVADINVAPGKMYGTKILAYDGSSMTIESMNDPSGMRTYTHSERCPSETEYGWRLAGYSDPTDPTYHAPAIGVAADGHVYSMLGSTLNTDRAFPRYQELGKGCFPLMEVAPAYRFGAMALKGDEIHTFYEGYGGADDFALIHRWRTSRTADWQTERIAGPPSGSAPQNGSPLYSMFGFVDGDGFVVVASRTNNVLEIYRRDGSGWHPDTIAMADMVRAEDAAIGPSGEIAVFGGTEILRFTAGSADHIALPQIVADYGSGGLLIASDGAIHATWGHTDVTSNGGTGGMPLAVRTVYGIYTGTWKQTELGPMVSAHPAPAFDGKLRVVSLRQLDSVQMILTEIAADGTMTSEYLGYDGGLDATPAGSRRLVVATGTDGSLAASFDARYVFVKHPVSARPRHQIKLTVQLNGAGRVYSDDGTVDCTQTCSVTVPQGSRLQLRMQSTSSNAFNSTCPFPDAHTVEGLCWQDTVPANGITPPEAFAVFNFL